MNTLQRGSKGSDVESLQAWLVSERLLVLIDGAFGPMTESAVRQAQARYGAHQDGIVGPETRRLFQGAGWHPELPQLELPPRPSFAPLTGAQRQRVWGEIKAQPLADRSSIRITNGWDRANVTSVIVPQLIKVNGAPRGGAIPWHINGVVALKGFWADVEREGLLDRVLTYAGSWVPRFVRGSTTTLSSHAHATAFDINAAWNGLGQPPAPKGKMGSVVELVPIAHRHGFFWGGHFSRPDGMHFELTKPDA